MSDALLHRLFNKARLNDRQVNELVGMAHGIIADGIVNQDESEYLQKWLAANTAVSDNPVVMTLLTRVSDMLRDGKLDREEAGDLFDTLRRFSGGDFELGEILKSTTLPLDDPQPSLDFNDRHFCFTGTFAFGSRRDCEAAVIERGGIAGSLTKATNYLVIGVYATESWAHSTYGRKIEKAVSMRDNKVPIAIVSEPHWVEHIQGT